jgi:DNA polymerase III epsilon subunit-like protein
LNQVDILVEALRQSPPYARLQSKQLELIVRLCRVLAEAGDGLPASELAQQLRRWFGGAFLETSLVPALERHGLFRRRSSLAWGLVAPEFLARPWTELPVCVVDVEATGGRPPLHRIIELGVVRREPDGRSCTLSSLVNPGRPLPPFVAHMIGLKQRQLDEAPVFGTLKPQLAGLLEGAILVAHDVSGDLELLNYEWFRETGHFLDNPVVCTVAVTRALRPKLERTGLEFLARELGIAFEQRHRALGDAEATAAVWALLGAELSQQGIRTVLDLTAFQGSIGDPAFISNRLSVERLEALPPGPGLLRMVDARGRVVHRLAAAALRQAAHEVFYPKRKLEALLKQAVRDSVDLTVQECESQEDARQLVQAESALAPRQSGRPRRRRHR